MTDKALIHKKERFTFPRCRLFDGLVICHSAIALLRRFVLKRKARAVLQRNCRGAESCPAH